MNFLKKSKRKFKRKKKEEEKKSKTISDDICTLFFHSSFLKYLSKLFYLKKIR